MASILHEVMWHAMLYALVLAGGRGERLRPHTDDRPKPMVEAQGKPILWYHLAWLQENGVTHVVVLGGYRLEVIREYFGDGKGVGLDIQYIGEEHPLGRGGAFRQGLHALPPELELAIATNGDVVTNQALEPLLALQHANPKALATVMLTPLISPYGIVRVDAQSRISAFEEKPALPHWINAGVYVLSRDLEPLLPEIGDHETTTFPQLAEEGRLLGFCSHAFWRSIDTAKDLAELETNIDQLSLRTRSTRSQQNGP